MSVDQGNKDVPGENLRSDNEKVDGGTTRVDSRVLPAGSDPSTQEISSPRTQRVDSNTFVPAAAPVNSPNSPSTPPQTQRVDKGDFIPAGGNRIDRPPLQTQHIAEKIVSAGSALVQAGPQHVKAGSVIQLNSGRYQILSRLGKPSGEAEVFLVELDNARYALKFYYAHIKPDQEVLSFLHSFRSPGVISLIEYGVIDGRTYELMEFAPGGSLVDTHVSGQFKYAPQKDFQRLKEFVQTLSEGLNDLHKQGILHKDIKPDNMFLSSEALQGVKIGDFGLAALVTNNSGKQITVQNRTADYAAPEIYRTLATGDDQGSVIVGKEVDFYALGITLLFLWKGANPFEGMSEFNTLHIKSEGNVVLPDDMPISLQRLVRGLITVVPKHRWGYAEIQRWLRGEHVELYEDIGVSEKMYPPLNLGDLDGTGIEVIVKSPAELAEVLLKDTQRGYQYLYQGTITDWVKSVDMPLASDMTHIISEEFSVAGVSGKAKKDRALAALNKAVYKLDPYRPFYTSGGVVCNGLIEIGEAIEKEQSYYLDAVANELDPLYLFLEARDMVSTVNTLHQHARSGSMPRPYAKEQAFNEIVLALQDWSTLRLNGKVFQSPAEMLAAPELIQVEIIQQLVEGDHSKVSLWLNRLMDQDDTWPERLATWRSLGNHTPRTLVYLLDPQSPFDFKGSTVLTTKEFLDELTKQLRALDSSQEYINASSNFVKEADFWLSYFAYSPEHTDTALDNIEFTGYAEVLSVYLTLEGPELSELMRENIKGSIINMVEQRFTQQSADLPRKAGVQTLYRLDPKHVITNFYKKAARKARKRINKANKKLKRQKSSLEMRMISSGTFAIMAAILLPLLLGFLTTPLAFSNLPVVIWIGGSVAMLYGFLRGIFRQDAEEDEVKMEARFITTIAATAIVGGYWLIISAIQLSSNSGAVDSSVGLIVGGFLLTAISLILLVT